MVFSCIFCSMVYTEFKHLPLEVSEFLLMVGEFNERVTTIVELLTELTYLGTVLNLEKVSRNIDLVYGGGSIGLMGLVSQAVYDGGRHVIGVIPKTLMPREITGETVGEVMAVADMHQRKAEMARHSDAFIALPGGYGTLEELLEVITWAQLGIHDKPVGLLNVDGYYNSLLSFIDKAVEEGFISPKARHIIVSSPSSKELVKKMEEYFPQHERVASKLSWETEQIDYS
ncbi:hypothetical protein LR48_Vigan08g149400 [Vigna angularis]|uniref:Cytokinin riboside 5'-monophosphate phosphoribohydrolase n=1 Tax=Phaseolus angularis TaxID=3914 RepID=A0A0L9V6W3_PHAAN|nr:hypothetical protein LR48_Vigan08g149400 [Vigna angularis]